jgi:hypothetical protein
MLSLGTTQNFKKMVSSTAKPCKDSCYTYDPKINVYTTYPLLPAIAAAMPPSMPIYRPLTVCQMPYQTPALLSTFKKSAQNNMNF